MSADPRRVAIEAIVRIDDGGAYANVLLPKLLSTTDLDGRDKGLVTELVYGSTRRRRALDHVVDRFLVQDPPPTARAALRIGAHQLIEMGTPPHAAVSATVSAAPKRFRGMVNAVLRRVATATAEGIEYPSRAVALSYPDWIVDRLDADLGPERSENALAIMNVAAPVSRRDDGYVQDESSRWVASSVPSGPGQRVLDLCAAPGGKATEIAARGATVVAAELHPSRARLIVENATRLGLDAVLVIRADGTNPPFAPASFDAVLVDAPCSGLGALRRRPDARWRIRPDDIERLAALQQRLLLAAAPLVASGGALVYSVCTLTRRESSGVVAAVADRLGGLGFEPAAPVADDRLDREGGVELLLPGEDHDGMCRVGFRRS